MLDALLRMIREPHRSSQKLLDSDPPHRCAISQLAATVDSEETFVAVIRAIVSRISSHRYTSLPSLLRRVARTATQLSTNDRPFQYVSQRRIHDLIRAAFVYEFGAFGDMTAQQRDLFQALQILSTPYYGYVHIRDGIFHGFPNTNTSRKVAAFLLASRLGGVVDSAVVMSILMSLFRGYSIIHTDPLNAHRRLIVDAKLNFRHIHLHGVVSREPVDVLELFNSQRERSGAFYPEGDPDALFFTPYVLDTGPVHSGSHLTLTIFRDLILKRVIVVASVNNGPNTTTKIEGVEPTCCIKITQSRFSDPLTIGVSQPVPVVQSYGIHGFTANGYLACTMTCDRIAEIPV